MELNEAVGKICSGTPLTKDTVVYQVMNTPTGFQATVCCKCLPDGWDAQMWAGDVQADKKSAEHSAAEMCLMTLRTTPGLMEKLEKQPKQPPKKKEPKQPQEPPKKKAKKTPALTNTLSASPDAENTEDAGGDDEMDEE